MDMSYIHPIIGIVFYAFENGCAACARTVSHATPIPLWKFLIFDFDFFSFFQGKNVFKWQAI